MFVPCFVTCAVFCVLFSFEIIFMAKRERESWLLYLVFSVSRDCYCSVVYPHGAVGWASECNCGIA